MGGSKTALFHFTQRPDESRSKRKMSMPNKPNPNLISEDQFFEDVSSGKIHEIDQPPVVAAGAPSMTPPPSNLHTVPPYLSGSLPMSFQAPHELARTAPPGVPSVRLWPIAPAGLPSNNSSVLSGTRGISVVANQANKTATSANTTAKSASAAVTVVSSTPVMQVDSGGSVVQAPVGSIGAGGGILTPTLDNLRNGLTYGRTNITNLTSGNVDLAKSVAGKVLSNIADDASYVKLAAGHASGNVAYNFKGAWSSATAYVIADEVTSNNIYWIALANNTNSQPVISNANWQAVGRIEGDLQVFTSSGTWNKPAAGQFAFITVIGGGGNGGAGFRGSGEWGGGGGGAGGVSKQLLPLSILGATENVTVGGNSSFGSWLRATGGGNGTNATSGGVGTVGATGTGTESGQLTFVGGSGGVGGSGTGTGGTGTAGSSATPSGYTGGTGGIGSGVAAGVAGNPGINSSTNEPSGGGGGGGGGASAWNNAGGIGGVGGIGGNYGAGGGGGGGSFGAAAGAGGVGAPGIVIVAVF